MTEEQNGSVPESGTKKPEQATVKKKAAAKSNASLGEQYLGALFTCASWISPAYKEMAEKAKGKLEVLKELYLCSCDGVSEEKALETLDKDNPEVMLRFIRQKCVEERATKGYEEELKEIRKAAALVRHEMQDMKEKMDAITEKVPSIAVMFPEEEPVKDAVEQPVEPVKEIIRKKEQVSSENEKEQLAVPESGTNVVAEKEQGVKKWKAKIHKTFSTLLKSRTESIHKYVESLLEEGYTDEQLSFLLDCLEDGDTPEQIRKYASPKLPVEVMKRLKMMEEREDKKDGE